MTEIVERYYSVRNGELVVGGISIAELAQRHGTPFFVYDRRVLDHKWAQLRSALPSRFSLYYSVKANPNQTLLRYFLARGCGLEIASAGELHQALQAGCPAERIFFAGPGKTEAELETALASGVGEIHVESPVEIDRLGALGARLGITPRIALRVNPTSEAQGGAMRMGGKPAPFGIDEETLADVVERVMRASNLDLRGVHLYAGTQILDHTTLISQYRKAFDVARTVTRITGRPLDTIDFGGGLGVPYFPHERDIDLTSFRSGLGGLLDEIRLEAEFDNTQFVVEPGRFLVAEAGIYVTSITDIKTSRDHRFFIVDGGMHHHLAASGNLGQVIKRNFPVSILTRMSDPPAEPVDVVGPLCTPLDAIGRRVTLPSAAIGDLIGVFQSGAYARAASPLGFLSHDAPPEIWVSEGKDYVVRRRGTPSDYLLDQCNHVPLGVSAPDSANATVHE